jgi:hypothetical protein
MEVMRATLKGRPVDRPKLEAAQLAYVCFRQQASGRSALPRRPIVTFAIVGGYLLAGGAEAIAAFAGDGGIHVLYLVEAVFFAALAAAWAFAIPRSVKRQPEQMAQLRRPYRTPPGRLRGRGASLCPVYRRTGKVTADLHGSAQPARTTALLKIM